ncbi:unnamed protein product [Peniophora sp. CBMAI 1063]|nr:unnamed protein product [Peniophora sp. CBMAI 1063]
MKFSGLAAIVLAVSVTAAPAKRDAATVESDLAGISTQVNNLNSAITRFGSSKSLIDALAIASDANSLDSAIKQATTDTTASVAFTEGEGSTILSAIQALAPNIVATLQNLDSQHDNVASLPIPGIDGDIESELNTLNTDTAALETALLSKTPSDDQTDEQTAFDTIDAAFTAALSTYSS